MILLDNPLNNFDITATRQSTNVLDGLEIQQIYLTMFRN